VISFVGHDSFGEGFDEAGIAKFFDNCFGALSEVSELFSGEWFIGEDELLQGVSLFGGEGCEERVIGGEIGGAQ
jgi:hypothetical protein